jgi:hypothetical protein
VQALTAKLVGLGGVLFAAMTVGVTVPVAAAKLPAEECDRLKGELAALSRAGVPDQMAQIAPAQARELTVEQRADIARYIKVEQQLLFRCVRPAGKPDPHGGMAAIIDPNEPQGEITDGTDIVLPATVATRKPKPATPPVAANTVASPKTKPAAKPAATATSAPAEAAAVKPKPKPKGNDAFVPAKAAAPE